MEVTPVAAGYTIDKMRGALAQFSPELQSVDGNSILVRVGLPKGATDAQQNERVREIKNILGDNVTYSKSLDPKSAANWSAAGFWPSWFRSC